MITIIKEGEVMLISSKTEYGLRAVCYLALQDNGRKVKIKEIAEKENISARYLEQIFTLLKQAGIVKSIKGPHGGYLFIKTPEELSAADVMRVLDPALFESREDRKEKTPIEKVLEETILLPLDQSIVNLLESISFKDILDRYTENSSYMYYI